MLFVCVAGVARRVKRLWRVAKLCGVRAGQCIFDTPGTSARCGLHDPDVIDAIVVSGWIGESSGCSEACALGLVVRRFGEP